MSNELLTLKNLKQYFPVGKDRFVRAVDGVDLTINHGDVMGLVGESGSGKSTIAYTVMGMYGMTGGEIDFEGEVFTKETKRKRSMKFRREAQIVFQDPGSSLNPYQDVRSILSLPLKVHKVVPKNEIDDKILEILEMVELPADFMYKSPNSIGGGEKQLVSIARALCCNPKFIILDEPTSSLDVSIQAKIINMLIKLKKEQNLTYMFITHDMGVVSELADDVAVMYMGSIVERGSVRDVLKHPAHPYTSALLRSIPVLHQGKNQRLEPIRGSTPDPYDRPKGCQFAPRCDFCCDKCTQEMPPEAPVWRLDLKSNQVDASRFPAAAWARLTRQVLSEDGEALLRPVPHQGLPALRQAIARDLREYKGMAVPPEQIVVGAGAEYLYLLLAQLLGREAVFAVEDPGYPKIRQVYGKCGAACRPVPLDGQGVPPEALEAAGASVVHLSPAHHYPTGLVTPIGRRQALLRWAEKAGGIIIEDDYDSEFRFTGRPIPTLQSIDTAGRVVYMNTFSQTISPSMRVGFMVLPPRLLEQYRRELDFYSCTVPALDQHVLARFLDQGHYEQHLARMRKEYRTRHDAVLASFRSSPFRNRITISEQGAGLHFLLRLDTRESDGALRDRAAALGVRLGFLSEYAAIPSPAYAHTLVVKSNRGTRRFIAYSGTFSVNWRLS